MRTDYEYSTVVINGRILEVTINRPDSYNALHMPAMKELDQIWSDFAANKDLWVGIVTGAGNKAFCAGGDLKYQSSGQDTTLPDSGFGGLTGRASLEKPIIAAINGIAMGGGLEIALACDILLAVDSAKFAVPEVKVGLIAGAGGVNRLAKVIPPKIANQMIYTGEPVDAPRAYEIGLVNEITSADKLMDRAREIANQITQNSPTAIKLSKRVIEQSPQYDLKEGPLLIADEIMEALMADQNFTEGPRAFAEKRQPNWTNS